MEPVWTKAQVRNFTLVIGQAERWRPALERLAEMGKLNPAFRDRIKELADRAENAELQAKTALSIDSVGM